MAFGRRPSRNVPPPPQITAPAPTPAPAPVPAPDPRELLRRTLLGQNLPTRDVSTPYNIGNLYGTFDQYANPFQNQFQAPEMPGMTGGTGQMYSPYLAQMYGGGFNPYVSDTPGEMSSPMYGGLGQFLPSQSMYQPSYVQQVLAQQNAQMYNPFFAQGMPGLYQNAPFEQPIQMFGGGFGGYGGGTDDNLRRVAYGGGYGMQQPAFNPYFSGQQQPYNPFGYGQQQTYGMMDQQAFNPFMQQGYGGAQYSPPPQQSRAAQNPFGSLRQGLGAFAQQQRMSPFAGSMMGGASAFTKPDMSAFGGQQGQYTPGTMNMAMPQSPGHRAQHEDLMRSMNEAVSMFGQQQSDGGGGGGGGGIF